METQVPALTLYDVDDPDGYFYEIGICLGKITYYFAIDTARPMYGLIDLETFLDICVKEGVLVDYNTDKHLVYEPKGVDDYRTTSIRAFVDFFAGEDFDPRTQQDVIRRAAKEELKTITAQIEAADAAH